MKVDLPIEQMDAKEVEEEQSLHKDTRPESGGDNPAKDSSNHPNARSLPSKSQKISEHASHVKELDGASQLDSHGDSRNKTLAQPEPAV